MPRLAMLFPAALLLLLLLVESRLSDDNDSLLDLCSSSNADMDDLRWFEDLSLLLAFLPFVVVMVAGSFEYALDLACVHGLRCVRR